MKSWNEMTHKEQLAASHYDLYKDVRGTRPRWVNYDEVTVEWLETEISNLVVELTAQEQERVVAEQAAIQAFEDRVKDTMNAGAKSREQAIAWIKQAENAQYEEDDYLCFLLELPYGYFDVKIAA